MEPFTPKRLQFRISEIKKAAGLQCAAHGCKNRPCAKKKGLCHTHYSRWRQIVDPVYNRFYNFKNNALRRGKSFRITLQEFRDWCNETGYIIEKGKRGRRCTVDRIRNWEGYYIGNIQILTMKQNITKYNNVDRHSTELPTDHPDYTPF